MTVASAYKALEEVGASGTLGAAAKKYTTVAKYVLLASLESAPAC